MTLLGVFVPERSDGTTSRRAQTSRSYGSPPSDLTSRHAAAGPDRAVETPGPLPPVELVERIGWTVAALAVLGSVVRLLPLGSSFVAAPALLAPATAMVFLSLAMVWRGGEATRRLAGWLLLGLATVVSVVWSVGTWFATPSYGTDAVAFNEQSADLLLQGRNPYGVDLASSLDRFSVPPTLVTLTLDGQQVSELSYPAGSILPLAALKALGVGAQAANILDVTAWLVALWLLFVLLPGSLRWVAVLLAADNLLTGVVTGGVTDPLYLAPLMLALWRWDRYGSGAGLASWLGPVGLGLACAVKQLPWFFAPFLLLGVCLAAHRRGDRWVLVGARYTGVSLVVFLLVNGPFIAWDPSAWLRGTFLPLVQPLVPDGQGLVSLIVQLGLGGGDLGAVAVAGYAGYLALLALVAADHDRWRRAWPLLVVAAFLLPSRSLSSYLLMATPAVLVALTSLSSTLPHAVRSRPPAFARVAGAAAVLFGAVALAAAVTALLTPAPLSLAVVDSRSTGARQTLAELTVDVRNTGGDTVMPRYTVTSGGMHSGWWQPAEAQPPLAPGEERRVVLSAPGASAMPGARNTFQVTAFAMGPNTVSTSPRQRETSVGLYLTPSQVPRSLAVGEELEVTVRVQDSLGSPLAVPDLPVALSQVVFAPDGQLPGTVSINGEPSGRSPVTVTTGPDGTATFTVVGTAALRDPVYLQSWIAEDASDPQSFSNYVSLRFEAPVLEVRP